MRGVAVAVAVVAAAIPSVALAGSTGAVEIEADLTSPSTGQRIATVDGSVGTNGRGYASIIPLSGAKGAGMVRGEAAQVLRRPDGSLVVAGGLGTRLYLAVNEHRATSAGWGRLALALHARHTVLVAASGVAWSAPYRPNRGQRVIVVGTSTGAVRTALSKRYQLVRYSPATYSRAALMRNPALYRTVAGVLLGQGVTAAQMNSLDLPRSFYNSGRWVATSGNPTALDQHMYVVAHAHLGRAGVIMRRATPRPGGTSNQFLQIREPHIVHVRVGHARTLAAKPDSATMIAAQRMSQQHLATALARDEQAGQGTSAAHEQQSGGSAAPPTVSTSAGTAAMRVGVDQDLFVEVSAPSWVAVVASWLNGNPVGTPGAVQCSSSPTQGTANPNATLNFLPLSGTCPGSNGQIDIGQQLVNLDYNNQYVVSLLPGAGQGAAQQQVTEVSSLIASAAGNSGAMAAGSYQIGQGLVQPATWGTLQWYNDGGTCNADTGCPPNFFQSVYSLPQESGLTLSQANHIIAMACTACTGTVGGTASLSFNPTNSSPLTVPNQVTTSGTVSSSWQNSATSSSGWSVTGNLGFFGTTPMGGVGGGYNSGTSSTTTTAGDVSVSTGYTYSNWANTPSYQNPIGSYPASALYETYSQNIPNIPANSIAGPAVQSVQFPAPALTNTGGIIPLASNYGQNNPGPTCLQNANGSPQYMCGAALLAGVWGSQWNALGYQQGSVSSFNVTASGGGNTAQPLAIGDVTPSTADSFTLSDQWTNNGFCECTSQAYVGGLQGSSDIPPVGVLFTELQVLDMDQVTAAQGGTSSTPQAGTTSGSVQSNTGSGIAGSLTTYYGANGQVLSGVGSGSQKVIYSTLGLDLCAPPVLTSSMWVGGCNKAPGLSGPPATAAGAGPKITSPTTGSTSGQATSTLGSALTCKPGTWSGRPTFSYQWQQWNATYSVWAPIAGATSSGYTPTTPGYVLCSVTAKNASGRATSASASVEMVPSGG